MARHSSPPQAIAPIYHQLANQHHRAIFLRVDVDRNQPIATKYNITAMPTFLVIRNGDVADTLRGADARGLAAMVARHAAVPPLSPAADEARAAGNAAFAAGDLAAAAAHYTRGLEVADLLEPHCPALEHAALLVHDASGSYWWRFRPARGTRAEHERVEHERGDAEE